MVNHNQTEAEQPEMVTIGLQQGTVLLLMTEKRLVLPCDVILTSRMAVREMVDHDHEPFKRDLLDLFGENDHY